MRLLANERITIQRKPDEIFEYVSNMENFGDWFEGVISIESNNGKQHGEAGKEYLEAVKIPFRGERKIRLLVVESDNPRKFVTEGSFPPLLPRMEIEITGNGTESSFSWSMYSRNKSLFFGLLFLPIAKYEVSKRAKISLANLKHKLEQKI